MNGILKLYQCLLFIFLNLHSTHNSIITDDKSERVFINSLLSKIKKNLNMFTFIFFHSYLSLLV